MLTVILEADGFDDLVERYEYLNRIQAWTRRSSAASAT